MIGYGNPNRSILPLITKESYLDTLLTELTNYPYPDNNSQEAIDEVTAIINAVNSIADNDEVKKRFELYDEGFESYIINVISNKGIPRNEVEDIVKSLHDDILPLLIKLKYHYQRIRPYQLSYLFGMSLYPYKSYTADSPSYPSGHSLQANVYCEVLANKYPKYYKQFQELSQDISQSRVYMGLHYPSDCTFAEYVSNCVMNHPEFKKKYKL